MSDPALQQLFRAQAARLGRALSLALETADRMQAAHLLHTLKGSALAAGEDALAQHCHAVEAVLLTADAPALRQALVPLLAALDLSVSAPAPTLAELQQSLRSGFVTTLRAAGQRGVLQLDIADAWLAHADFLLDTLPHLLRNAIAHGGETVAVRIAAGKPEALQVRVRARVLTDALMQASRLVLLVTDDGRGTARPSTPTADLMAGRGWGVAAVRAAVAQLPDGRLRYRGSAGRGSCVRITCRD